MGFRHRMEAPPGQTISVPGPIIPADRVTRDFSLVRHRTMDFEVWGVVEDRPSSLTFFTPGLHVHRPCSEMENASVGEPANVRVPVLGPTRQQTDVYLKRRRGKHKRHNVLPLDGPAHDISTVGGRINAENLAIFDDKAANAVLLDAESQLKSGYPTIATSSLVARRNRIVQLPEEMFDTQPDMKFFSDLVKPIQYRWKFQNQNPKVKTLTPSKHGFHPRSQSPTFQRLIEATERLQVLSEDESGIYVERHDDLDFETQSQIILDVTSKPKISRSVKSEPNSTRALSLSPSKESSNILSELKPEIKSLEQSQKEETTFYEEDEEEIDYVAANPTPRLKTQQEFKVDFKRTDSHSELHLFLPHILDAYSRGDTPENAYVKNQNNKLTLPSIGDISEVKTQEDEKAKHKRNQKSETKKKKKKHIRVKSGNDDKEIPDRLNDVPTLISLEKEKDVHHPASMCVFENCQYHMHKKSTKLRQP